MSRLRISDITQIKVPKGDSKAIISRNLDDGNLQTYSISLSNFSIPTATENKIGGVGTYYEQNEFNYPLSTDENGRGFVYVPWTDYHVQSAWYEKSISSLIISFNDSRDFLSVSLTSLMDFYHADNKTMVLDEETKKFSVKLEDSPYCPYDKTVISSGEGKEGDCVFIRENGYENAQMMRFDIHVCENQKDLDKTDSKKFSGMIRVNTSTRKIENYNGTSWITIPQDMCSYCGKGRFLYNDITKKIFYNDGTQIYCVRKQRSDD